MQRSCLVSNTPVFNNVTCGYPNALTVAPGVIQGGSDGKHDQFCGSVGSNFHIFCRGADASMDRAGCADASDAGQKGGSATGGDGSVRCTEKGRGTYLDYSRTEERGLNVARTCDDSALVIAVRD